MGERVEAAELCQHGMYDCNMYFDGQLLTALARVAKLRVCEFKPQVVANSAWAFVTASQLDMTLCSALASAAELHIG